MTVRHRLSERQWSSVSGAGSSGRPVLARFEIVDAYYTGAPGGWMCLPAATSQPPVSVTAMLYWAYLDPEKQVPPTAMRLLRADGPGGQAAYYLDGPRPVRVRVEAVAFSVEPEGASTERPTDFTVPRMNKISALVIGKNGWSVRDEKVLSSRMVAVRDRDRNDVVPLYDPCVHKLPKGAIQLALPYPRALDPWGSR
jgi:hypothetical protein